MLLAIGSLALIGISLGGLLGIAARYLAIKTNPLEAELKAILPGSQCGQCGFVGCGPAAAALAGGKAKVTLCIPGGKAVAEKLAERMRIKVDLSDHGDVEIRYATIDETKCIGCMLCIKDCTSDAIMGAPKQIHAVLIDDCHGCMKCFNVCPTEAVTMHRYEISLIDWHWEKPKIGRTLRTRK